MKLLHALMRFYSYLFTLFLSLFLTGFGVVAFISDQHAWNISTYPWTGKDLSIAMLILGVMGIGSVLLAFFNIWRGLMPVMALILFGLLVYGFFWQNHRFRDAEDFQGTIAMAVGAAGSFFCSLILWKRERR
jgi:hypothetical protein